MSDAPAAARPAASPPPDGRRGLWLLAAGALIGAVTAGREVLGTSQRLPSGAAALVNGVPIARVEFEQAIAAAAGDRGSPLDRAEQDHILDRLIDEELLFAHALALDLPRRDARLHSEIVSTLISQVAAPPEGGEPTDAELAQHLEAHRARFQGEPLVRVEALLFAAASDPPGQTAGQRATSAARRLRAGEPMERIADSDRFPLPVPTSLSSRETLTAALGPTATRTALGLPEGAVSDPVRTADGHVVLRVLERRASVPQLADVRAQVRDALLRKRGEDRLRETIDELRARADVRKAD